MLLCWVLCSWHFRFVGSGSNDKLGHVRWLGGGTGAGKSTIAVRLAEEAGWRYYSGDEHERRHIERLTPERHPYFTAFLAKTMDDRWVHTTAEELFAEMPARHGESLALILEDLRADPDRSPIVVEGHHFPPALLAPMLTEPSQSFYLLPAPEFRRFALEQRGALWSLPNLTSDPARCLANRLGRDALYTGEMRRQCVELGIPFLEVNGQRLEDVYAAVAASFAQVPRGSRIVNRES